MQVNRQTDDYTKEMEKCMAHWTTSEGQHLSRAQLQVLSSRRRPGCCMALSEVSHSSQWGWTTSRALQALQPQPEETLLPAYAGNTCLHKQGESPLWRAGPSHMSPPAWQCHSGLPPLQPALSHGQNTRVKEQSPQAQLCFHMHRRATTKPLLAGHTLPKHKMLLPHSVLAPFRAAGWESWKAVIEQEISSCYRNIQQDTARQLLMSVALNHKHFELFWYNGKLWEGERKRTGQK